MASLDIGASVAAFMAKRKEGFSHDRVKTVGASEIGACARMVAYRKSSTPVDAGYVDSSGAAARGDIMEDGWSAPLLRIAIEAVGGKLLWAGQENQMSLVNPKGWVSATPDGLAINMPADCITKYGVKDIEGSELVTEFKSIDPRTNSDKLPKSQHVDQVNLQMGLIRSTEFMDEETGELTKYQPNYGIIVYTDAADYTKMQVAVVKYDHAGYLGQLTRAKTIMKAAGWVWDEKNDMPAWQDEEGNFHDAQGKVLRAVEAMRPEGKISGGSECRYCAFSKRCLGYAAFVPKVAQIPDKKVVTSIRKLAHMVQAAKDAEAEAAQRKRDAESELKEMLAEAGTKFLGPEATGDVIVSWKTTKGRTSKDTAAMERWIAAQCKKMGKEVPTFETTGKPSESLNVELVDALAK
jgi:hypothetical protein